MAKKSKKQRQKFIKKPPVVIQAESKRQKRLREQYEAENKRLLDEEREARRKNREKQRSAYNRFLKKEEVQTQLQANERVAQKNEYYLLYKKSRSAVDKEAAFLKWYAMGEPIDIIEDFLKDQKDANSGSALVQELSPSYAFVVWQLIGDDDYSVLARYVIIKGTDMTSLFIRYSGRRNIPTLKNEFEEVTLYKVEDGSYLKELK
jgi:hypothetical protein